MLWRVEVSTERSKELSVFRRSEVLTQRYGIVVSDLESWGLDAKIQTSTLFSEELKSWRKDTEEWFVLWRAQLSGRGCEKVFETVEKLLKLTFSSRTASTRLLQVSKAVFSPGRDETKRDFLRKSEAWRWRRDMRLSFSRRTARRKLFKPR